MSLIDSIIGAESGGNADARNPNSSASGLGQFIDATWVSMLAKHRPDIQGSRDELLALKNDPTLSRAMTEAYAADNGKILTGAGFEASPGNTYLAHFAGPQGAVKVLSADPNAPVSAILGEAAVKANPFLQGMTAADLQAWAARKMGGASQPTQPQNAQTSPAGPANRVPAPSVAQPDGTGAHWDSNYGQDQNYCEEDVALLWVFDTAVLLASNANASTIKNIEVVCATYDATHGGLTVNMETQKATLSAFMLKGVTLG